MAGGIVVLMNAQAGALKRDPGLAQTVAQALGDAEVKEVPGHELSLVARRLVGKASAVVAAGGDGTVSAVAGALVGTDTPLGVIATGTLNHFARDAGLPTDLPAAAAVITGGKQQAVDVAEVNGRVFVNNSALGLYPHIVRERDVEQARTGRGKWLAMGKAALEVLRRFPLFRVRLEVEGEVHQGATPLVFVGNNLYAGTGKRERLDEGTLCVHLARTTSRSGLMALVARALVDRLDQSQDVVSWCTSEVRVTTRHKRALVSLDGEILQLPTPLVYRSRPGALRLLVP